MAKITRATAESLEILLQRDSLTEDWVLKAMAEDWVRFALLRHMVKRKNKKKWLVQGTSHLPGKLLINLLEALPNIHQLLQTCRQPYETTDRLANTLEEKYHPKLQANLPALLTRPEAPKIIWAFIAKFINSVAGVCPPSRHEHQIIFEHSKNSGYNIVLPIATRGQRNIPYSGVNQ